MNHFSLRMKEPKEKKPEANLSFSFCLTFSLAVLDSPSFSLFLILNGRLSKTLWTLDEELLAPPKLLKKQNKEKSVCSWATARVCNVAFWLVQSTVTFTWVDAKLKTRAVLGFQEIIDAEAILIGYLCASQDKIRSRNQGNCLEWKVQRIFYRSVGKSVSFVSISCLNFYADEWVYSVPAVSVFPFPFPSRKIMSSLWTRSPLVLNTKEFM